MGEWLQDKCFVSTSRPSLRFKWKALKNRWRKTETKRRGAFGGRTLWGREKRDKGSVTCCLGAGSDTVFDLWPGSSHLLIIAFSATTLLPTMAKDNVTICLFNCLSLTPAQSFSGGVYGFFLRSYLFIYLEWQKWGSSGPWKNGLFVWVGFTSTPSTAHRLSIFNASDFMPRALKKNATQALALGHFKVDLSSQTHQWHFFFKWKVWQPKYSIQTYL